MREEVSFLSNGLQLSGHLYIPDARPLDQSTPAIVVAGPMTGVKEQVAGTYAERLSSYGLIALAFDPRNFGASEGEPRQHIDCTAHIEDLKNALSFLATRPEVDADRLGACGVCVGGGYVVQLAAFDRRVKAATIIAAGINLGDGTVDAVGKEGFVQYLAGLAASRQAHYPSGDTPYMPAVAPNFGMSAMMGDEPWNYYNRTSQTIAPSWRNQLTVESMEHLLSFNAVPAAHFIAPTPLLVVHGTQDAFCAPKFAQQVYDQAEQPKDILWLETTNHTDLYDQEPYVTQAVERAGDWFTQYLLTAQPVAVGA